MFKETGHLTKKGTVLPLRNRIITSQNFDDEFGLLHQNFNKTRRWQRRGRRGGRKGGGEGEGWKVEGIEWEEEGRVLRESKER